MNAVLLFPNLPTELQAEINSYLPKHPIVRLINQYEKIKESKSKHPNKEMAKRWQHMTFYQFRKKNKKRQGISRKCT